MTTTRGECPPKHSERSRPRRTRKRSHQAGSPVSNTTTDYSLSKSTVARFAYVARKATSRTARRLFYAIVGSTQRPREPTSKPGLGYAPVPFVREETSYVPRPSTSRLNAKLRLRSIPNIAYDERVAGTILEAPAAKICRRQAKKNHTAYGRGVPSVSQDERLLVMSDSYLGRFFLDCPSGPFHVEEQDGYPQKVPVPPLPVKRIRYPRARASDAEIDTLLGALSSNPMAVAMKMASDPVISYQVPEWVTQLRVY